MDLTLYQDDDAHPLQFHKIPATKWKQPIAYKFLKILLERKHAFIAAKLFASIQGMTKSGR